MSSPNKYISKTKISKNKDPPNQKEQTLKKGWRNGIVKRYSKDELKEKESK